MGVLCMRGPGPAWFSGRCITLVFPDVAGSPNLGPGVSFSPGEKRSARYYAYLPSVLWYGSMLSLVLSGSMLVLLVPAFACIALAVQHWRFRIGSKA